MALYLSVHQSQYIPIHQHVLNGFHNFFFFFCALLVKSFIVLNSILLSNHSLLYFLLSSIKIPPILLAEAAPRASAI